jgi:hypothetical protein
MGEKMKPVSTEKIIEGFECDVFPITIVKYLLNKRKILSFFEKGLDKNFEPKIKYIVTDPNCEECKRKESEGMLCRQHTSIDRVYKATKVLQDLDTNTLFYKNEIFKMVGQRLVIVYCPHPKLLTGKITDSKVRKINPITVEQPGLTLPEYQVVPFLSSNFIDENLKCWFNNEFSIITIPKDRNSSDFCLIPNS